MGMNAHATCKVPNPKFAGNVIANASKKVKIRASEKPERSDRNNTIGSLKTSRKVEARSCQPLSERRAAS